MNTNQSPLCPKCSNPMVLRTSARGKFYGCSKFSRGCRGTLPFREERVVSVAAQTALDSIVGSPEQEAIWNEIKNGRGHAVVNALAGSGKSFTCRYGMHKVDSKLRILYLAFNKSIVNEFKANAPANAEVCTLNSIGFRIIKNNFKGQILLDKDKIANLVSELYQPSTKEEIDRMYSLTNAVDKLVSLCQGYLIEPNDIEAILEVAARHEVELNSDIEEDALRLVPKIMELDKERHNVVSYNDMLWLPIVKNLAFPKYDLIFVDEAQDLNPCQHQLVLRLLANGGRVIVVGDSNQAIYGFRGSDVESINNLANLLRKDKSVVELPLTVTRRCGKKIVEAAQEIVPSIKALPDAHDGEVIDTDTKAALELYSPGDMVVCRCNAPLTGVAYRLIKRGVKVVIRGRDIGQGLIVLIKKMKTNSINELLIKLDSWKAAEMAKVAGTRREQTIVARITDQHDCILSLSEDCTNISELIARIESIFANFDDDGQPKSCVVMSSIHRAKGLEADRVFYLMPELTIKCTQDWQEAQESNLRYVGITRARNTLFMVADAKQK